MRPHGLACICSKCEDRGIEFAKANGARAERKRIRRALAPIVRLLESNPTPLAVEQAAWEIGAATRAPKPKRAVRPVTTKEGE